MKEYIKIAWRNLWRNRTRTAITTASIFFAVFLAVLMRSFQLGTYDNMIKNAIESYSGFIQVQQAEYKDEQSIDYTFSCPSELISQIKALDGVKAVVPRVESFALASTGQLSKGVVVLGVDPELEANLSDPASRLVRLMLTKKALSDIEKSGEFDSLIIEKLNQMSGKGYPTLQGIEAELALDEALSATQKEIIMASAKFGGTMLTEEDDGVLVSSRLAKFLQMDIGDTLILIGQGYHGASAAGLFPIRGIVKIPAPDLDNKIVYTSLKAARTFFNLEDQVTSLAVNLYNNSDKNLTHMKSTITESLSDENLLVRDWKEFNKVLVQQIEGDSRSGQAIIALLYFIIFFGIFGTVLMMIFERYREFGVLVSIGMQKYRLAFIVLIEMLLMSILGIATGILSSIPLLYLGHNYPMRLTGNMAKMMEDMGQEPIMPLAWLEPYIAWQAVVVSIMVVLACIYPMFKILFLKEVEALRS